eukprot:jgi/Mesvir1/11086/Mv02460-RA.1
MDVEPIYCAEQILVPPDLGDILKAYYKEVLRKQPENILEFSARYFADLAAVSGPDDEPPVPTVEELRLAYAQLRTTEVISKSDVKNILTKCGVHATIQEKVLRVVTKEDNDMVDPKELVVMLLTTSQDSFLGVVHSLFEVFGTKHKLTVPSIIHLLGYLAKRDRDISQNFLEELEADLGTQEMEINYADFSEHPMVKALVSGMSY